MGLYLPEPARTLEAVLAAGPPQRVVLHLLRAFDGSEIAEAIADGFARNAGDALPRLQERLDRFKAMLPAVEPGDVVAFTVSDDGTEVIVGGTSRGTIEGAPTSGARCWRCGWEGIRWTRG